MDNHKSSKNISYIKIFDVANRDQYVEYSKKKIKKTDLISLKNILKKVDTIVISQCNGYIVAPSELKKIFFVPFYSLKYNSSDLCEYTLIMICGDINLLSEKDKILIEKVFNQSNDRAIWYTQESISPAWSFSSIRAIPFYDADNKMYFIHTRFSPLFNQRELSIKNGECEIYIDSKFYRKKNHDDEYGEPTMVLGNNDDEEDYEDI